MPDPASESASEPESNPESEDAASQPADRQTGAKHTRAGGHATAAISAPLTLSIEEAVAGSQTGDAWRPDREDGRVMIYAPADVARLFRATLASLRRHIERRTGRLPTSGEAFEAMLDHATAAWAPERCRLRAFAVHERDDWRCTVPGCSSLRNLHDHHVRFRAHGGSDDLSNRTTLCAWHHLRAVHRGLLRCSGLAPHGLRFELGIRTGHAPLAVYRSGDVRVTG